jgi:hypothetical protein
MATDKAGPSHQTPPPSPEGIHPDDQHELVPLAEPDEHGHIQPPPLSSPPPAIHTPTVVTERYASPGAAPKPGATSDQAESAEAAVLVRPGFPGYRTLLVLGGILTLTAVGLSGYEAKTHTVARSLSTLYDIAVHTGTGIVAMLIATIFTERRFNDAKLAASRMFFMVALLYAIVSVNIPIPTTLDQWILGLLAYALAMLALFRLPQRDLGIIGLTHFGLWLIVKLGASLEAFIASASTV